MAPALTKIAKKGIESAADFLKSFSDKIFYHSTTEDIKRFDPEIGIKEGLYPEEEIAQKRGTRGATYLSSDIDFINQNIGTAYKDIYKTGTNIMPLKIKDKNLFDYKDLKDLNKLRNEIVRLKSDEAYELSKLDSISAGNWYHLEDPFIQTAIKNLGYRGYKTNEPETVAMFYPEDIRSIFAKFDPAKSRSDDILASGLVGATSYGAFGGLDGKSSN